MQYYFLLFDKSICSFYSIFKIVTCLFLLFFAQMHSRRIINNFLIFAGIAETDLSLNGSRNNT